jgi:Ca2+-binding RTX toxin-like protein
MPAPVFWGSELLLNTTAFDFQGESSLSALADGRFVVAWSDYSQSGADASFYGVRAQMFNADGSPSGAEFQVNGAYDGDQRSPSVTALANGRFVVAWTDGSLVGADKSSYAVRAQVFNADGSKFGREIQANTTTTSAQWKVSLEALSDGRFVAVWDDYSQTGADTSAYSIRGQLFNANGSKSGNEFLVNTTAVADQTGAHVTALTAGGYVVAWSDYSQSVDDPTHYAVRAQVFNADGTRRGSEFLVNSTTADYQGDPRLSALNDGGFVAVWSDYSQSSEDSSGYAVRAQRFDANGHRLGIEFGVPATTWGDQFDPTVATLADGRFVVAWTDFSQTGADSDLYAARAQVFQADGSRDGDEFLLATTTAGDQHEIALTVLADGRLMASWTDSSGTGGDTSSAAVRGQVFDPREAAIRLVGTGLADQWVGTQWADTLLGGAGNDHIRGGAGNDLLSGGLGADTLQGGDGKDRLTGGGGADQFVFATAAEAGLGAARDVVADFVAGVDRIDLSAIDANTGLESDQAFSFLGAGAFTGVAGQLRYVAGAQGLLAGDTNGDGVADFHITLLGNPVLSASDLLL